MLGGRHNQLDHRCFSADYSVAIKAKQVAVLATSFHKRAIDGIRTRDLSLTKRVLYQLSYDGAWMLRKEYICPGSNRRPSACKADVITNYTTDASLVKHKQPAALAQLGERQTEDLKVPGSIPGGGIFC